MRKAVINCLCKITPIRDRAEEGEVRNGQRKKGGEERVYKRNNSSLNSKGYVPLVKFNQMFFKYNGKYMGGAFNLPTLLGKK
jgi:hypothetical protein